MERCSWCLGDPLYISYHDNDWGVPVHDDRLLFEMLCLEGAQAGLNWFTILKKRENYKKAFDDFDVNKIINYTDKDVERLKNDKGIVRNRLKIQAVIKNARGVIQILEDYESFDEYIWSFVDGETIQNAWPSLKEVPANTDISDRMSKDLKKRGFSFVGSTICYAYMQSIGMVNDHIVDCFRYEELK